MRWVSYITPGARWVERATYGERKTEEVRWRSVYISCFMCLRLQLQILFIYLCIDYVFIKIYKVYKASGKKGKNPGRNVPEPEVTSLNSLFVKKNSLNLIDI